MAAESRRTLRSMRDVHALLAAAGPGDREDLKAVRDWMTSLVDIELGPPEALERARAARDVIDRVLSGETTQPEAVLAGAVDVAAQVADLMDLWASGDTAPEPESGPSPPEEPPPRPKPVDRPSAVLPPDTDDELLREYIAESIDHIAASEAALLELETNPEDAEALNTVFRAFHTIKGTSGFLGLNLNQELAHKAESILSRAREGEIRLTGKYADLSLESCDLLKAMIQTLDGTAPGDALVIPPEYELLLARLKDPEGYVSDGEAAGSVVSPRVGDILVAEGKVSRDDAEQAAEGPPPIGEQLIKAGAAKSKDVAQALRAQRQMTGKSSSADATIRVSTGRLDSLINMVGELVIAHSMVAQDPDVIDGSRPRLVRNVSHSSKIVRELQDLTMALRMVPLKGTFQKMARLVRDLSRKSGKTVQFVTEGEDTEIDRNMVEVLNDPLVHMIRNSVDHGIEPPQDRAQHGKSESGTVRLRAYHGAGNVIIELTDDGRGLDRERIVAKAVERGLISSGEGMEDAEVFALIFQAGFSTAEKVTDVSGRGVGMDVVKKSIESLRGRIHISSQLGARTTITLQLPLTMAITDAMLVRVGQERYLLPTVSIEQSFRPDPGSLSTVEGRGEIVKLRGDIIPIVRLSALFSVDGALDDVHEGLLIAVEAEGKRCALMVDDLLGQHQVVVKSLGEGVGEIPGVSGGTILGDGRVGLILDVAGLLKIAHAGASVQQSKSKQAAADTASAVA